MKAGIWILRQFVITSIWLAILSYETQPSFHTPQKRIIESMITLFRRDDLDGDPLPEGIIESRAIPYESYKMAFTTGLISNIYADRVTDPLAIITTEGGYVRRADGNYWLSTGKVYYKPKDIDGSELDFAKTHFFLPHRFEDPFGNTSCVVYDDINMLLLKETCDPFGNVVTVITKTP